MTSYKGEVKLSIVGNNGVGKSALVMQFCQNVFITEFDPTIEDSYRKGIKLPDYYGNITSDSPDIIVDILDTAESEYSAMRDRYMRTTQGFAVVYSVTSWESFDMVDKFVDQILRVKDEEEGRLPIILVANKLDLEDARVISSAAGRDYAARRKLAYIETSAKTADNVQNLFVDLTKKSLVYINERSYLSSGKKKRQKSKRGLFSSKNVQQQEAPIDDMHMKVPSSRLYGDDKIHKAPVPIVIPASTYLQDMKNLESEMDFADVIFKTLDSPELIPAHKFIVISRCRKMRQLIEEHDKKSSDKQSGISVPCKAATFKLFLDFAYTDSVNFTDLETELHELLDLATEWDMSDLVSLIAQKHPEKVPASVIPAENSELHSVPKFKRDLRRCLIASGSDYKSFDVKFSMKDEPGKAIFAHKAILAQRSPYFRAMFTGGTKEKTSYEVEMSEFGHLVFLTAIEYCYTDDVRYIDDFIAADLLVAANKLCLGRLKLKMSEYIVSGMHWDNLIQMFKLATLADAEQLRERCSFYICRTLNLLAKSHNDYSMLTSEEVDFFKDSRLKWADVEELELYWQRRIMDKGAEPEKKDELVTVGNSTPAKGCGIM